MNVLISLLVAAVAAVLVHWLVGYIPVINVLDWLFAIAAFIIAFVATRQELERRGTRF